MEIVVDNFAGGGGASTGIEKALGRPIDIAINHDPEAIAMHLVNHPNTKHLCESVWKVNPIIECAGRPVGLAWFSPDCKHFSKAKGTKPVSKKIRGLAWVVLRWAATVKPRIIMLENVEEFMTWGPVVTDENGKQYPCPKRRGRTYRSFINALKKYGYDVEVRILRACDYGDPTIRKRLFLIARCDGQPIVWPEQTHGDPKSDAVQSGELLPWRTAAECIKWEVPCRSIFERKKSLAEATLRRIAKGIKRYVIDSPDPFIVTYYGDKEGEFRGQPITEPLRTQTTENRHGLVVPHITKFHNNSVGSGIDNPMPTVTANSFQKRPGGAAPIGLVSAHLMPLTHQGSDRVNDIKEPFPTVTAAHRGEMALVAPVLTECANSSSPRCMPADEPLRTICAETKGGHHALVSAFLAKHYGGVIGSDLENPIGTVTTKDHHSLVTANLIRNMGGSIGYGADEPARTVTQRDKDSLVATHIVKLKGTNIGQDARKPLQTITAGGYHFGEVRAFLMKYYGTDQDPKLLEPLHTVTTKDRFGLVSVHGEEYQIVDIGMRMLVPRELFRAQGFPDSYIIDHDINGKPFTKTAQVRMCGNSVCPGLASALVKANMVTENSFALN